MVADLPRGAIEFLIVVEKYNPEATVQSNRWAISLVAEFQQQQNENPTEITVDDVAEYIVSEGSEYTTATQRGIIDSLSNYIAYTRDEAPHLVKRQIIEAVQTLRIELVVKTGIRPSELDGPSGDSTEKIEQSETDLIELLVEYLRHCDYGSRTHAIVEILLETGCRGSSLQQLDLDDIDFQQSTISIQNPETKAIPSQTYEASLSDACIDVVETYAARERIENEGDDAAALFTTTRGRISPATIRRSIKQAGEKACEYHTARNKIECPDDLREGLTSVSLRDFRSYALKQLEE